jgi:hypothetical protein
MAAVAVALRDEGSNEGVGGGVGVPMLSRVGLVTGIGFPAAGSNSAGAQAASSRMVADVRSTAR